MSRLPLQHSPLLKLLVIPMAFVLLFSFGLHAFQIDHTHPGSHATAGAHHDQEKDLTSFGEYLHGSEKKLFLLVLLGFLALGAFLIRTTVIKPHTLIRFEARPEQFYFFPSLRTFDINCFLLRTGVIHSKVY